MAEQVRIDADPGGGTTRRYSGSCIGDQERQDQPVQPKHAGPACTARRVAPRDQITKGSVTVAWSHATTGGWCARRDSNPHDVTHCHLKAARLPIPPRALKGRHRLAPGRIDGADLTNQGWRDKA